MSLSNIRLRYYTDDEIRTLAVVKVEHASTYDRGVPKQNGMNDPRMGLADHTVRCATCAKANCDQHFGYIELCKPVYRLGSLSTVLMVLRCVCRECAMPKFSIPDFMESDQPLSIFRLPAHFSDKPSKERLRALSELVRGKLQCPWCNCPQPTYAKRARTFLDATYRPKDLLTDFVKNRGHEYVTFLKTRFMPEDASAILFGLKQEVAHFLGIDRPETLLCRLQIVPPPNVRPTNMVGETKVRSENDMTTALQDVLRSNIELKQVLADHKESFDAYDKLQIMVSGIVNHTIKRNAAQQGILPLVAANSKRKVIDLKSRLNGKKARVRGNLNGKRVDQSGRTVISGDASHDIDQLGVPTSMMNKLTFPETVTSINLHVMCKKVIAGAYVNEGALAVRPPSHTSLDNVIWLPILDIEARTDLASQMVPGWIVERHLVDGDWVLFNRQPSLWKASMLAFRVYRVQGLTVRLPLPVTRAFNADFDGDEMNIHSLQGYEAIAEAQELMAVSHQIVTPQSNSVIIGLVQDSLVGAWRMTAQDCFFTKDQAMNMLGHIMYSPPGKGGTLSTYSDMATKQSFCAVYELPEPAILKPVQLWTGKQIVSLLLPSTIALVKNPNGLLEDYTEPAGIVVKQGQLLCGRLSKPMLGAANTGIVHAIWRSYGGPGAHKFISDAQRLFVSHLMYDGPTQSIVDCLMGSEKDIRGILQKHLKRADDILTLKDLPMEVREAKSSSILQETLRAVGGSMLTSLRPTSGLANCVQSGSKGNQLNIAQIGGCVGQQTIYGRRVPMRKTRLGLRTLCCFSPNDLRAEARGFVSNSYITGLTPAEMFMHQMAGREGIVATAVNTSESGYNQRRMIKGQESQCLGYDGTVRVSSNIIIQTMYGGDDLDGSRLEKVRLSWITSDSYDHYSPMVKACRLKALRHAAYRANTFRIWDTTFPCAIFVQPFLEFEPLTDYSAQEKQSLLEYFMKRVMQLHARHHSSKKAFVSISVSVVCLQIAEWIDRFHSKSVSKLLDLYAKAFVAPGEGVGALGATSIGEPSMQMTLNVFHYSGIADKNVTITGLPRFKQLINSVDTYETANMSAQLNHFDTSGTALQVSIVMLSDVLDTISDIRRSDTYTSLFQSFGTIRGPFATKFGKSLDIMASAASAASSAATGSSCCSYVDIMLSWQKCASKQVTTLQVSKSLRDCFSYDALVIGKPHWSTPCVRVVFAPWIQNVVPIVEGLLFQHQIRGLLYVKNAIVLQDSKYTSLGQKVSRHLLETEGSNMIDFAKCTLVCPETIRTSNVVELSSVLGISAGISVLQAELHKVLSFDSSYIDPRHTWLLADTMGRSGNLAAMNRHHMETMGSSLLQRASFEQSLDVFEEGAAFGRSDPLAGATERIITGQPVSIGTGMVGIVHQEDFGQSLSNSYLVAPMQFSNDQTTCDADVSEFADDDTIMDIKPQFEAPLFDPAKFGMRLIDASKVSGSSFLDACVIKFRECAAQRRTFPTLEIAVPLSKFHFRKTLEHCLAYDLWTFHSIAPLLQIVEWQLSPGVLGKTSSKDIGIVTSTSYQCFYEDTFKAQIVKIYAEKELGAHEVPFGVEALGVTFKSDVQTFQKGSFELSLFTQWSAFSNTEAEASMLRDPGTHYAFLRSIDSETLLQTRCTDIQLANALLDRLPK